MEVTSFTILSVAYPLAPVGPDAVGGAEQVLTQLDAALVRAGHKSIVIACEGSVTAGRLVSTPRHGSCFNHTVRQHAWALYREAIDRVLADTAIDAVHFHGLDFYQYLPTADVPVLATLHLPPSWYPPSVFGLNRPHTFLHCVSANQQRQCPAHAAMLPPIANGVSPDLFPASVVRGQFVLCLGRICPEKGFHIALDAAKQADCPLLLAGEVFPYSAHQRYFQTEIAPRLDRYRRFLGPVGFERKRKLLSQARCLLVPSLVAETSSLVTMEALACGTPVVAFRVGALPEIVEHGRTGFLVDSPAEMAACIDHCGRLSSSVCATVARDRFSVDEMVRKYFEVYARLADSGSERQGLETACAPCWK